MREGHRHRGVGDERRTPGEQLEQHHAGRVQVAARVHGQALGLLRRQVPLVQALARRAPVALDLQGFVRVRVGDELVYRPWPEMETGLKSVTYLKADRAEAESTTGETDLGRAARALSAFGPREVLITETAGVTVLAGGQVHHAPFTSRSLAGRTGRGDTAFASYLAARLSLSPAEACSLAARVTSEKQETPGPWKGTAVLV